MKKMVISQVFNLWQSYQEIKFRLNPQQIIPAQDYPVVTACNPRSRAMSQKFNRLRMQKLQRYLDTKHIVYRQLICGSPDFSWSEPSLAVSMPLKDGIKLARLYQQNAIYQVADGELWLVPVLLQGFDAVKLGRMEEFLDNGFL